MTKINKVESLAEDRGVVRYIDLNPGDFFYFDFGKREIRIKADKGFVNTNGFRFYSNDFHGPNDFGVVVVDAEINWAYREENNGIL